MIPSSSHTSITDDLFARPEHMKIFVSSKMRGGALAAERKAVVEAIKRTGFAQPWAWEQDACAGPFCSESICIGHARTSDGLVLIVGRDITEITYKEYYAAYERGVPCYIFIQDGVARLRHVTEFVQDQQSGGAVTKNFRNLSELRTHVTQAIRTYVVQSARRDFVRVHAVRSKGGKP